MLVTPALLTALNAYSADKKHAHSEPQTVSKSHYQEEPDMACHNLPDKSVRYLPLHIKICRVNMLQINCTSAGVSCMKPTMNLNGRMSMIYACRNMTQADAREHCGRRLHSHTLLQNQALFLRGAHPMHAILPWVCAKWGESRGILHSDWTSRT